MCRAIISTEVLVGLVLMMLLSGLAADAMFSYRRTSTAAFWRHAAVWAVDAQLQRYQAGAPLDSLPPPGVIPEEITLKTNREPGQGPWQGFDRITIRAEVVLSSGKAVHEQVSAYVPAEGKP